jgi:hypothetical protein
MPCCSWRAKSSSESAGSGGFRGFVVEEGSDVEDEAAGAAEDEVNVGRGRGQCRRRARVKVVENV